MYTQNVQVPHEFFKKSKNEYYNWQFAFLRELIQNSVDAHAKKIEFWMEDFGSYFAIRCADDGSGMNEDIILNKLLCLGGSHKEEGSTGGFGYAKTLLFFAHKEYKIVSRDNIVEGSGGSFNLEKSDYDLAGTDITVQIEKEGRNASVSAFVRELKMLVNYSNFKTKVYLEGEELEKGFDKFDFGYETPIGKLKFSDTERGYSELWVRVNGIPMFRHSIFKSTSSNFEGVIELNKKSTEVMTSNRDALKSNASTEFDKVFNSLQNERSSFKSSEFEEIIFNAENAMLDNSSDSQQSESVVHKENQRKEKESNKSKKEYEPENVVAEFSPFKKVKKESEKQKNRFQSFMNKVNTESYNKNFVVSVSNSHLTYAQIKDELNKSRSVKLAQDWDKIVRAVLYAIEGYRYSIECINGDYYFDQRPIMMGFHFGNEAIAVNSSSKDGYKILINPVLFQKEKEVLKNNKLLDLAIHEVTHIFTEHHDESFCTIEGEIKWAFYERQKLLEVNIDRLIA